ncbi:iron ABC transporter permease [Paenibacillus swuensis]|uniref:Iron ABC transporter permease n=1 Tax=Paenibacillus swuensis TaxID=1178515 RepID=A0A172TFP3_9BACL|nr:iron ABC transporter permease [Paenibacillus swuensis]ANE45603.1 iron ABC transporter permease [Paenibacillus swuensis]
MTHPLLDSKNQKNLTRSILILTILTVLIVAAVIVSMNTGFTRLTPMEVMRTFFGFGTQQQELILFSFRLPRIVIALLVGAGLAVSGCILQGISRNPLAEPGILGFNAGAGLAVVVFISMFPVSASAPIFMLPLMALLGAGITALIIYVLAYSRTEGLVPMRLVLSGIAVAAGISAATIVLTLRVSPEQYQFIQVWMAGSIWGSNWKFVLALLPWILVLLPLTFYKAQTLNVLNLGDAMARSLGAAVDRERLILLACSVGLAGACVAVSGSIAFVGLIAPHLSRRLVGSRHGILLPASALTGSLLVIVADTIGRSILPSAEIPTGLVIAVIGAPYFLFLMTRARA